MTILITGAAGSIGRELTKKLIIQGHDIIALDRDERRLVELKWDVDCKILIRDINYLDDIPDNVELIYHLAAIKHVPICEQFPNQAIETNILGSENIIRLAKLHNSKLIHLSTDKSIDPVSIYGMTKRVAEKLVSHAGFTNVISGNVFGSSGSVVPLFLHQIKEKNEITLTNKKMTRYFVNISDVVDTLISAKNRGGEIVVTGYAFKMIDVANAIIGKYGNKYTTIKITGSRNGEKLHESLSGILSNHNLFTESQFVQMFL
jgi:FlaA1/EpsC-like NDP-sugar epimerase